MNATRTPVASRRAAVRREREREIVAATRRLFDERGLQDAPIEDIARAVGINKALIYRHFSSKEELFVLTLTSYLGELAERLEGLPEEPDAVRRLEQGWRCYTDFCLEYPAFLDCGLSLMRQPAEVAAREHLGLHLDAPGSEHGELPGQALRTSSPQGAEQGAFEVADPDFTANRLYTQTLGTMQLARLGVGVRAGAGGVPEMFPIDPRQVQEACIADVLASVGATRAYDTPST